MDDVLHKVSDKTHTLEISIFDGCHDIFSYCDMFDFSIVELKECDSSCFHLLEPGLSRFNNYSPREVLLLESYDDSFTLKRFREFFGDRFEIRKEIRSDPFGVVCTALFDGEEIDSIEYETEQSALDDIDYHLCSVLYSLIEDGSLSMEDIIHYLAEHGEYILPLEYQSYYTDRIVECRDELFDGILRISKKELLNQKEITPEEARTLTYKEVYDRFLRPHQEEMDHWISSTYYDCQIIENETKEHVDNLTFTDSEYNLLKELLDPAYHHLVDLALKEVM